MPTNQDSSKSLSLYDHKKLEKKWQKKWATSKIYRSEVISDKKISSIKLKYYILDMFPYPSGVGLHVGHPKGYIATDIVSRMKRMQGFNVLHPMGFDAFGLPAENYAIKTKTNPEVSVKKNVVHYKEQLEILGCDYDWSREINTTDPKYYHWTQWIFLQIWKKGLAYESYEPINWCPSCKTGLANEDVEDGRCERCGTPVEKKPLRQWVLKITDYAERLLNDIDMKDTSGRRALDWPASIVKSQKDWIGRSEGSLLKFEIEISKEQAKSLDKKASVKDIEVFTTRPDTLFGVTYVVLAPEHKLVAELLQVVTNRVEVESYISRTKNKSEIDRTDATKEKTGVELKGISVINPANGEKVPVWIADYVLADYGTGAVMAVPAHDERDFAFAQKFGLQIKNVIIPDFKDYTSGGAPVLLKKTNKRSSITAIVRHWSEDKYLILNWKKTPRKTFITGGIEEGEDSVASAKREILEETGYDDVKFERILGESHGHFFASWKDENHDTHITGVLFKLNSGSQKKVAEEELEKHSYEWVDSRLVITKLNETKHDIRFSLYFWDKTNRDSAYTDDGVLVNSGRFDGSSSGSVKKDITDFVHGKLVTKYKLRDWVFSRQRYWGEPIPLVHCEKCGVVPVPEKDLPVKLPKVKSYEPTGTGESPLATIDKWVNTKCPICGRKAKRETNTMPQWAGSSWYYLRYMDPKNAKSLVDPKIEKYWSPVDFYIGGAEHATRHLIYARFWHKFLYDIGVVSTVEPFAKLQHVGLIMGEDGRKMSKRFGNVVDPVDVVNIYGADTLRIYEMFMGPFDQQISWSTDGMIGSRRFVERVWRLADKLVTNDTDTGISPENYAKSEKIIHKAIKKVSDDIASIHFNTAISTLMITVNELEKTGINKEQFESLIKLLAPFAPHMTEELWSGLGNKRSIHLESWPIYKAELAVDSTVTIAVQVNGKIRGSFEIDIVTANIGDEKAKKSMEESAKNIPEVKKWIDGKEVKKIIVVKCKLVSIVI